ncbi:MAG: RNA polymerase subunit sigma-70, partial [Deltaproteobacteria bacterium]|nr:RNA polymerase subunit sigma-70 [Deltaproteobacteria bacterium]
ATAARQIERARRALLSGIRRALMETLAVNESTCQSVLALVRSNLDVSVRHLLKT